LSLQINTLTIDAADPQGFVSFWVAALDWHLIHRDTGKP
jgi:hypothetical protein